MNALWVVLQVLVAMLAIMGFWFVWRWMFGWFFAPRQVTAAVLIQEEADLENLDILLAEAEENCLRRKGVPLVVVLTSDMVEGLLSRASCMALLETYGAVIYVARQWDVPSDEGGTDTHSV